MVKADVEFTGSPISVLCLSEVPWGISANFGTGDPVCCDFEAMEDRLRCVGGERCRISRNVVLATKL